MMESKSSDVVHKDGRDLERARTGKSKDQVQLFR
jgi:hypothetical protein